MGGRPLPQPPRQANEDAILDGRNRHAAALEAGVTPTFTTFSGTPQEALQYAVRSNLHRRHLTTSQRAMIAAAMATLPVGVRADYAGRTNGPSSQPPHDGASGPKLAGDSHHQHTTGMSSIRPRLMSARRSASAC